MLQSLALWSPSFTSALQTELETGDNSFTLFNFSNVDANNYPSTRTCVSRGFLFNNEKSNVLVFTTDKRSSKYNDLLLNPRFDACYYFGKMRKQFRFKGTVRMISDDLTPNVIYIPKDENEEGSSEEEPLGMNENEVSCHSCSKKVETIGFHQPEENQSLVSQYLSKIHDNEKKFKISEPLHYKLFSPSYLGTMKDSAVSLAELGQRLTLQESDNKPISRTPTKEEWQAERLRVWNSLSRSMKTSYKKPTPGSPLTEENRKLLDAINRGVDGNNSSSGYENFVVVCMFVELVDEVVLGGSGYDHRYLYRLTSNDTWKEYEVCP